MTSGDEVESSDSSQSFDIDCIWGKFISSSWSESGERRWDMGGCEEVPSYQLPWSEGLLNREPNAALDGHDGPNNCILSFVDLAFGMLLWLPGSKERAWERGRKRGRRWKVRDGKDRDDLIQSTGRLASHSEMLIKISSVIVYLIIKRFETQLPSKPPASPKDRELSDRWCRHQYLNGILSTAKIL